jgi:hypothetical protein
VHSSLKVPGFCTVEHSTETSLNYGGVIYIMTTAKDKRKIRDTNLNLSFIKEDGTNSNSSGYERQVRVIAQGPTTQDSASQKMRWIKPGGLQFDLFIG